MKSNRLKVFYQLAGNIFCEEWLIEYYLLLS